MNEVPLTCAVAEYQGRRFRILFGGDDWVALEARADVDSHDAFASGESSVGQGQCESWTKVPVAVLDGVVDVTVTGSLGGRTVSLRRRLPDGRIAVEFVGPPADAGELDWLETSTWDGPVCAPEELKDMRVEENRRA